MYVTLFVAFLQQKQTCLILEKHYVVFFLFLNSNSWIQRPLVVFVLLYFILFLISKHQELKI